MLSWYFFANVSIFNKDNVSFYFLYLTEEKEKKQLKQIGKLLRLVLSL